MNNLVTTLSSNLSTELRNADEIWIAVALINESGLKIITENIPDKCIQNYLIGIDLPTDPKALRSLLEMQFSFDLKVNIFSDPEYFHPKLYLIRKKDSLIGFVGSANCTNGGLNKNIELSVQVDNQESCKQLLSWFEDLKFKSKPLTNKFLIRYKEEYEDRIDKKKKDEQLTRKRKKELNVESEATLANKVDFIYVLSSYRADNEDYRLVKKERKATINDLRLSLDYPNFDNINIDSFFSIWELGHIISLPKPTILREIKKFAKLLKMLCDEQTDISVRYNRALEGDLKIRGINEGLISKVLVIHNPELYFVKNQKSNDALKKYGIELPKGLSKGDKYKITCRFLRQICIDTNIDNLAILDHYLYLESQKK
jgi:HKD family nuclease